MIITWPFGISTQARNLFQTFSMENSVSTLDNKWCYIFQMEKLLEAFTYILFLIEPKQTRWNISLGIFSNHLALENLLNLFCNFLLLCLTMGNNGEHLIWRFYPFFKRSKGSWQPIEESSRFILYFHIVIDSWRSSNHVAHEQDHVPSYELVHMLLEPTQLATAPSAFPHGHPKSPPFCEYRIKDPIVRESTVSFSDLVILLYTAYNSL